MWAHLSRENGHLCNTEPLKYGAPKGTSQEKIILSVHLSQENEHLSRENKNFSGKQTLISGNRTFISGKQKLLRKTNISGKQTFISGKQKLLRKTNIYLRENGHLSQENKNISGKRTFILGKRAFTSGKQTIISGNRASTWYISRWSKIHRLFHLMRSITIRSNCRQQDCGCGMYLWWIKDGNNCMN